jgi:hypothetical protein
VPSLSTPGNSAERIESYYYTRSLFRDGRVNKTDPYGHRRDRIMQREGKPSNPSRPGLPISCEERNGPFHHIRRLTMKKIVLATAAVLAIFVGAAPSFAGDSSSIDRQSANIQAGGGAYPAGVLQYLHHK